MKHLFYPVLLNYFRKDIVSYFKWCKENVENWEQNIVPSRLITGNDEYNREEFMLEEIYSHLWWIDSPDSIFKPYEIVFYFKYKADAVAFKLLDFPAK